MIQYADYKYSSLPNQNRTMIYLKSQEIVMKLDNVDLNNIKIAVFDFDETLAIHKDRDFTKHRS